MNVLVTGANGFLGRFLVEHLRRDRGVKALATAGLGAVGPDVPFHPCDLERREQVEAEVAALKPDVVYHLAGVSRVSREIPFEEYFFKNTLTTLNLTAALERNGRPATLFFTSSVHVYGQPEETVTEETPARPESPYGFSKYLAEEGLREAVRRVPGLRAVVGRLYSCLGPGQPAGFVAADLCRKLAEAGRTGAKTLKTGPLTPYRRFLDARDAVRIFPLLVEKAAGPFEIYNIASPHELLIADLLGHLLKASGLSPRIESEAVDPSNRFTGLRLSTDKLHRIFPPGEFRPIEATLADMWRAEMSRPA